MKYNKAVNQLNHTEVSKKETALLIFTRSLEEEFLHKAKPLNVDADSFQKLYNGLLDKTLDTTKRVDVPTFVIDTPKQEGSNFGERITNAIKSVFEKGFNNIIVLGNDSPNLKSAHLKHAISEVENGKAVIGPDLRGGVYLFGFSKDQFTENLFIQLPWQKEMLASSLSRVLNCEAELGALRDVNSRIDLFAVKFHLTGSLSRIVNNLLRVIINIIQPIGIYFLIDINTYRKSISKRGPPMILIPAL